MKLLITLLLTLWATVGQAFAEGAPSVPQKPALPEGSYRGRVENENQSYAEFMVRPLPERNGSYAVLLLIEDRANIYIMDPLDGNSRSEFSMTPLQVTGDGEVGIVNDDPSLILSITAEEDSGMPGFTITNANSRNQIGFQGTITFRAGKTSNLNWIDFNPATYSFDAECFSKDKIVISPLDANRQARVLVSGGEADLNGSFSIREKVQGLYTLKAIAVKNTGPEVATQPKRLAMFLTRAWSPWKSILLIINPAQDGKFKIYSR